MNAIVLGVGNPFRRDDGVGAAVATALREQVGSDVTVRLLAGEPVRLLDAWEGASLVVVVDATRGDGEPGTVHTVEVPDDVLDLGELEGSSSSHGLGVETAIALARALNRLPTRLVVVGVAGTDFGEGPGLSPAVEAAVPTAIQTVLHLLDHESR